jgi:hypothetical protein
MKRIARRVAALAVAVVGATTVTLAAAGPASASCGFVTDVHHCVWKNAGNQGNADMRYYGWNEDDWTYADTSWNYPGWSAYTINDKVSALNNMFAGCYNTYYTDAGYSGDALGAGSGSNWSYVGDFWNDKFSSHIAAC